MASEAKTAEAPLPNALSQYVILGNSSLRVSPLCLGTMTWGGKWGIGSTKEEAEEVFNIYVKAGGNFLDTANFYHAGHSEIWLGEFMAKAGNREELVIATKYSLAMKQSEFTAATELDDEGKPKPYVAPNSVGNHRKSLRSAVKDSLKRLGTDYIDLYYVHYWDYITKPAEIARTMNDLVSAGTILHWGISDAPVWAVAEVTTLCKERNWEEPACLQYKHSLLDRTIERDVLHYARHRNTTVVTWDALGSGKLTGKFKRPTGDAEADAKAAGDSTRAAAWGTKMEEHQFDIVDLVVAIAGELSVTPAQVALAWAMRQANVLPLVGARTPAQLKDNLGAISVNLSADQMKRLDEATALTDKGFVLSFIGSKFEECPWVAGAKVVPNVK